ncbi:MAG: hypothetical protein JW876_06355 [Candidatus Krumholzibacteriota bacterium]|nr:hypothetical protein [Candidatus Krumholzibacteriota bacterium]
MKTTRKKTIALAAAALLVAFLGGCNEYRIAVSVDGNGGGTRAVELTMEEVSGEQVTVDVDEMPRIFAIGDDATERIERRTTDDGSQQLVYRTSRTMKTPADWAAAKTDVQIDAALAGGDFADVRFTNSVSVETDRSASGRRYTYRETFAWRGLLDVLAEKMADRYVFRMAERFPDLTGEEKAGLRGAMAGVITVGFKSMREKDDEMEKLREFASLVTEQSAAILGDRITGSAKSHVFDLAHDVITDPQDILAAQIQRVLPGVLVAGHTGIVLEVTMPGRIVETNGTISGESTVRWEIQPLDMFSVPREALAISEIAD